MILFGLDQVEAFCNRPGGVTVAMVAGHLGIGAYGALRLLRQLKAERSSIVASMRGETLIFRHKDQPK